MKALFALYFLVGVGHAFTAFARWRRWADVGPLLLLWPLYAPLLFGGGGEGSTSPPIHPSEDERALFDALDRAQQTSLKTLLPDRADREALAQRLREAKKMVSECEALLRDPAFDEAQAVRHLGDAESRESSDCAVAAARSHVQNIARLRAMHARSSRELEDIGRLLIQLRVQAEIVRLSDGEADGVSDLLDELVHRIEGLDVVLESATSSAQDSPS